MPQSRTRSRAAMRSKYRKPKRRRSGSIVWTVAIVVIFIVGIGGVFLARAGNDASANTAPQYVDQAAGVAGDHWHTYFAVDVCGEWLDPMPQFDAVFDNPSIQPGIHSHGDGLIHTHPFQSSEGGSHATIGKFMGYGGWSLSADSIDLGGANSTHPQWPGPASAPKKTTWSTGDTCPFGQYKGQKVEMTWMVDGKKMTGNPSDHHQQNGQTVAVYFLPKGAEQPFPPGACTAFDNISDNSIKVLSKQSPCRAAASATTTTPATTAPTETAPTTSTP